MVVHPVNINKLNYDGENKEKTALLLENEDYMSCKLYISECQ